MSIPSAPVECDGFPNGVDWRNPPESVLREYAEDMAAEFIEYIIGYDKTLLLDFAMQNKLDFKEFVEG